MKWPTSALPSSYTSIQPAPSQTSPSTSMYVFFFFFFFFFLILTFYIYIYVQSPGGSVTAGMAVFDTMRHVRPDVSTVCVGLAASMGAFLLASGHQGKRYSLANSRIMIHQPLGGAQGQAADIEIQANEILHHKLTLNGYLAEFTGQPIEQITMDTDRDFFMSAQEAVEYGLIDAVVSRPQMVLA